MATAWPDEVDRIIGGDMTAALAYVTPAGGLKKARRAGTLERLREPAA